MTRVITRAGTCQGVQDREGTWSDLMVFRSTIYMPILNQNIHFQDHLQAQLLKMQTPDS
jgi:hypothetical protein